MQSVETDTIQTIYLPSIVTQTSLSLAHVAFRVYKRSPSNRERVRDTTGSEGETIRARTESLRDTWCIPLCIARKKSAIFSRFGSVPRWYIATISSCKIRRDKYLRIASRIMWMCVCMGVLCASWNARECISETESAAGEKRERKSAIFFLQAVWTSPRSQKKARVKTEFFSSLTRQRDKVVLWNFGTNFFCTKSAQNSLEKLSGILELFGGRVGTLVILLKYSSKKKKNHTHTTALILLDLKVLIGYR